MMLLKSWAMPAAICPTAAKRSCCWSCDRISRSRVTSLITNTHCSEVGSSAAAVAEGIVWAMTSKVLRSNSISCHSPLVGGEVSNSAKGRSPNWVRASPTSTSDSSTRSSSAVGLAWMIRHSASNSSTPIGTAARICSICWACSRTWAAKRARSSSTRLRSDIFRVTEMICGVPSREIILADIRAVVTLPSFRQN